MRTLQPLWFALSALALTGCLSWNRADVPDEKWNDWRWHLSNRVNDLEEIEKILKLTDEEREGLSAPATRRPPC